jgi:hypothetical protein
MTAEEIEAVAEFVLALGSSNDEAVVVPNVSPGTSTGRLYTQLCATCHGDDGKGRGTVAPFGENLDAASVAAMIVNGGSRMPDYPDLSEASLNALVAHTLLLANGEPPADVAADGDSEAVAAAALGTNDPTPSPIHDVQTADGSGLPTTALVVVALGLLGLAGGVVYTRMRASRAVAQ